MKDRILLRLRKEVDVDTVYEVAGNPHSQNGLISLVPVGGGQGFSARFTELSGVNDVSKGWLMGYASGNEPELPPDDFPESRVDRERAFYYRNGYPLPPRRSGLVCVNATFDGLGEIGVERMFDAYSSLINGISTPSSGNLEWQPLFNGGALRESYSMIDHRDIRCLFTRLNVDVRSDNLSAIDDSSIRFLAHVYEWYFDTIEIEISLETRGDFLYRSHVSVNVDSEYDNSLRGAGLEAVRGWLRSLFLAVINSTHADCASVSPARASGLSEGFLVSVSDESDPIIAYPGWLTYLSDRVVESYGEDGIPPLPSGFSNSRLLDGVIIEFTSGLDRFSEHDANLISGAFPER